MFGFGTFGQVTFAHFPGAYSDASPVDEVAGGSLHYISCGIGDPGEGVRVPQTLHVIEHGIIA